MISASVRVTPLDRKRSPGLKSSKYRSIAITRLWRLPAAQRLASPSRYPVTPNAHGRAQKMVDRRAGLLARRGGRGVRSRLLSAPVHIVLERRPTCDGRVRRHLLHGSFSQYSTL